MSSQPRYLRVIGCAFARVSYRTKKRVPAWRVDGRDYVYPRFNPMQLNEFAHTHDVYDPHIIYVFDKNATLSAKDVTPAKRYILTDEELRKIELLGSDAVIWLHEKPFEDSAVWLSANEPDDPVKERA